MHKHISHNFLHYAKAGIHNVTLCKVVNGEKFGHDLDLASKNTQLIYM